MLRFILNLKSINNSQYENIWKSTLKTFYTILFLVLRHNIPSIISFMCNVMMKVHAMAETINLISYTLLHWCYMMPYKLQYKRISYWVLISFLHTVFSFVTYWQYSTKFFWHANSHNSHICNCLFFNAACRVYASITDYKSSSVNILYHFGISSSCVKNDKHHSYNG